MPYLQQLARTAKTRASMIHRLSYSMPPHLLATLANGLLMGKILTACPVTIPVRLNKTDRSFVTVTEDINKAIKATARTITKTKLSMKIRSEDVLRKANLRCLNEAVASITALTVWKSHKTMDPLGQLLFQQWKSERCLRSQFSKEIQIPVRGYPTLASNIMARVWNSVPELEHASSVSVARELSRKWAKTIPR